MSRIKLIALDVVVAALWVGNAATIGGYLLSSATLSRDGFAGVIGLMSVAVVASTARLLRGGQRPPTQTPASIDENDEVALFKANLALAAELLKMQQEQRGASEEEGPSGGTLERTIRRVV